MVYHCSDFDGYGLCYDCEMEWLTHPHCHDEETGLCFVLVQGREAFVLNMLVK